MDPDQALKDFLAACIEAEKTNDTYPHDEAKEAIRRLCDWVELGGFLPTVKMLDPDKFVVQLRP